MGEPKFSRVKFDTPSHPWKAIRIQSENELLKKYGLKNMSELWKCQTELRHFREKARQLQARLRTADVQAKKEKDQLIARLNRMGLLEENMDLNDILSLNVEAVLTRRLQTMVHLKGLAHTPKQARQFIIHGHIMINGRRMNVPGYIVKRSEVDSIMYSPTSPLTNELHPMRTTQKPGEPSDEPEAEAPKPAAPAGTPEAPTAPVPQGDAPAAEAKPAEGSEATPPAKEGGEK